MRLFHCFFAFALLAVLFVAAPLASAQPQGSSAVIYYNEACGMCSDYLSLVTGHLHDLGIDDVMVKDYVNVKDYRKELLAINDENNIPPSLQGHLVTIVDGKYFFEGHVPMGLIDEAFSLDRKILIYQDEMGEAKTYEAWLFRGDAKEYPIDQGFQSYVSWFDEHKEELPAPNAAAEFRMSNLLPVVLSTGLLAGIHPCTIAVLFFFLAFMFTLQASKKKIFLIGLTYITGIFVAFSAIGLGLFKAMVFTTPHFAARIAGVLVILLGLFNVYQFFFRTKVSLGLPKASKKKIAALVQRSSVPAGFLLGLFVGTCSFGCTAGIYFSILGLVASQAAKGVFYLLVYNLMFIVPLIIILLATGNRRVLGKMQEWQQAETKYVKLIGGVIMVLIGIYLILPLL